MPWHLSRSDPRKVYDSAHNTVCVCQTAEQAALIVKAVNALPDGASDTFVKLREPIGTPSPTEVLTHTNQAEACCARALAKASLSGVLDKLQPFECPTCSTQYVPKRVGPVVQWEPNVQVGIFRPR